MRLLQASTALRARAALRPHSVVIIDRFGTLSAAELLAQAQLHGHRGGRDAHSVGGPRWDLLPPDAPLRQVLVTALATHGALELRSSGSTGRPCSQRRGPLSPTQLTCLADLARRVGLRPGRRVASAAPGVHGHGLLVALGALALGAPLVDLSHQPAASKVALLHRTEVSVLTGVPVHLADLMQADQELGANRPLRIPRVVSGSDQLQTTLQTDLARHFRARVHDVYGTTETGPLTVDGRPLRGVRLQEQDGLLLARTPFTSGRTLTTDRGRIDPDGMVEVTGRADGAISSGGMLHDPAAVVRLLRSRPGITAAQLRVVPDDRFGSRTIAEVTYADVLPASGAPRPEELRALVRDRLGAAAVPREVRISSRER